MQEAVSKLEAACCEYRTSIYPIHLDILNQQIAILQTPLAASSSDTIRISRMLVALQKKLCSYVDSVGDIVPRLLEGSRCDGRVELSETLK
jgi:hypothetical protein